METVHKRVKHVKISASMLERQGTVKVEPILKGKFEKDQNF